MKPYVETEQGYMLDPLIYDYIKGKTGFGALSDSYGPGFPSRWQAGLPINRPRPDSIIRDFSVEGTPFTTKDRFIIPPSLDERSQNRQKLRSRIGLEGYIEPQEPPKDLPATPLLRSLDKAHLKAVNALRDLFSGKATNPGARHPSKAFRQRVMLGRIQNDPLLTGSWMSPQGQRYSIPRWLIEQMQQRLNLNQRKEYKQLPKTTPDYQSEHWKRYGQGEHDPQRKHKSRKLYNY
jgi:hypothetical protein